MVWVRRVRVEDLDEEIAIFDADHDVFSIGGYVVGENTVEKQGDEGGF